MLILRPVTPNEPVEETMGARQTTQHCAAIVATLEYAKLRGHRIDRALGSVIAPRLPAEDR